MKEPTDAQVDAARRVLAEEIEVGGFARVSDYLGDGPGPYPQEAWAAFRAADREAEQRLDDLIRRALAAAFEAAA